MKAFIAVLALLFTFNNPVPDTISSRFKVPAGYTEVPIQPNSFGAYLSALPLMPASAQAVTYRGDVARTDAYTASIIDMSIGKRDLQQCADVVIRLRGEYLYHKKDFKAITFNFTSGFKCDYVHYAEGYRYANGKWVLKGKKDYGYANFLRYMELVFSYAGTLSLEKELVRVANPAEIQAGDVFIKGGSPGHCFIVLNVATNQAKQKVFLLAQSFMPAQSIQILQDNNGPWFNLNRQANVPYGELIAKNYLKRFR